MSGGLAPSKSTVYISNLPFSLTNNDLHKLFEEYGKVVKVTVLKDTKRRSKGVAFVLFLKREEAAECVKKVNGKDIFGRKVKASIAIDNGRSTEFIRKRTYPDKSHCYECGEEGHQSYECPQNALGPRQPPPKKHRIRKKKDRAQGSSLDQDEDEDDSDVQDFFEEPEVLEPDVETLSAAIKYDLEQKEQEEYEYKVATGKYDDQNESTTSNTAKRKAIKPSSYFSDEEELSD